MLLSIAILALIGWIFSIIRHANKDEFDMDITLGAILIISTWSCNTTLGIITLSIVCFLAVVAVVAIISKS
jgi:hypothetical protein